MCREGPLRATEAAAAELGVCGIFYLKLFENTLLYCASPPSVRPIRARAYSINTPKKMYKIQRISPLTGALFPIEIEHLIDICYGSLNGY